MQRHVPAAEASPVGAVPTTRILKGKWEVTLQHFYTSSSQTKNIFAAFTSAVTGPRRLLLMRFVFFHYRVQMLQSTDWKLYMAGQWPSVRCCSVGLLGQIVYNSSLILLVAASRKNIIFLSCGICGCNCVKCKRKQLLAFLSFSADC